MKTVPHSVLCWLRGHLLTFIAFLIAFALREYFVRQYGELPPFVTLFPVVVLASVLGNVWNGLLATLLSLGASCYWMYVATGPAALHGPGYLVRTLLFCTMAAIISVASDRYHRDRERYLQYQIDEALRSERRRVDAERDIMEAANAERQRFLDVLETLPQMICLLKPDFSLAFVNRSFREKFGVQEGHHCYENCFERNESCRHCERRKVFDIGQSLHWEVKIADGSLLDIYALPFTDVDGSQLVLEMAEDITERRRVETELKEYRESLELLVRERTSQLEAANARLEADIAERKMAEQALLRSEKLASAGRMAATIAHEINNPLEAVTNTLYLARMMSHDSEAVRKYLDMAEDEVKGIAHITRQALGFYRESNAPAMTSITCVMESAVDLLSSKIKAKHVLVEKQWKTETKIRAVGGELRQVFSNLLANSLDAIGDRGKVTVKVSEGARFRDGSAAIRVTVSDSGKGILAEVVQHIFEPFFTTKGAVGTGLGLWVSKQIVDNHGGVIRVRSSREGERQGTTFSILLPVSPVANDPRSDEFVGSESLCC